MEKDKVEDFQSRAPICKMCGVKTYLTSFRYIKSRRKKKHKGNNRLIYMCPNCHNYVNVHKETNLPLGHPGDKEVRIWRIFTHKVFDKVWQKTGNRAKAYTWLARRMGINEKDCHIGMFDSNQCKLAIEICIKELARKPDKV